MVSGRTEPWDEDWRSQMARPASYKRGGRVKKSGFARVHRGERVIPVGRNRRRRGR